MSKIKNIIAREIKDSRGNPTIEVELETDKRDFCGILCRLELQPEKMRRWNYGMPMEKEFRTAIKNVNKIIAPKLKGKDVLNQQEIDELMIDLDGTENKSKLGANAILAVSMAVCRAGAGAKKVPLYQHICRFSR